MRKNSKKMSLYKVKRRIRMTRIWGNFWMLNFLVHFLLALHLLHVWGKSQRFKSLKLTLCHPSCDFLEVSYRFLLSVQHIFLWEESQAVLESHLPWSLLQTHNPLRKFSFFEISNIPPWFKKIKMELVSVSFFTWAMGNDRSQNGSNVVERKPQTVQVSELFSCPTNRSASEKKRQRTCTSLRWI